MMGKLSSRRRRLTIATTVGVLGSIVISVYNLIVGDVGPIFVAIGALPTALAIGLTVYVALGSFRRFR